jgi:hypothetical protein
MADPEPGHEKCRHLADEGRRLASQREDLIADGVDPEELGTPVFYWCLCLERPETIEDIRGYES